jgi:probable rRNA maturation factor
MAISRIKNVRFHYLETRFYLPDRTELKKFILKIFDLEGIKVNSVNYIFCSDHYLIEINRKYLNHDTYTDIITFPYSFSPEPVLSDIYISIDRIRDNAKLFKTSFKTEIHRVMFHGALHLCGYKDKSKKDKLIMKAKEDVYLNAMFHVK